MQSIFKVSPDDLMERVQFLVDERFGSLERVLSDKNERAQFSIEVVRDTKKKTGKVYSASGHLIVDGKSYHTQAREESVEAIVDSIRDDLVRKVRNSRGRTARLFRRGGSALKSLLRFGK